MLVVAEPDAYARIRSWLGRYDERRCAALRRRRRWKSQPEHCTLRTSALHTHVAIMVLHDLLNGGQTQSDALFFSVTDEGLEETFANGIGNSRTVVRHSDLNSLVRNMAADVEFRYRPKRPRPR